MIGIELFAGTGGMPFRLWERSSFDKLRLSAF
jgi:hypothetical protein